MNNNFSEILYMRVLYKVSESLKVFKSMDNVRIVVLFF